MKQKYLILSAAIAITTSSAFADTGYFTCTADVPYKALADLHKGLVNSENVKNVTDCYKEALAQEKAGKKPTNTGFLNSLRRGRNLKTPLDEHLTKATGTPIDVKKTYK